MIDAHCQNVMSGTNMSVTIYYQHSAKVDHDGRNTDNLALHPWRYLGT